MEFELTPELTGEIIFAMEDQSGRFLFDSIDSRCVSARGSDDDEDRYYSIPTWDSVSGFRMMDRFIAQLRNPVVREELRSALSSGHGVFRKFKDILKSHPEVERLWHLFKDRELKAVVLDWYNDLRDFWGLERVGAEPEETDEIVSQDFGFREYAEEDETELAALFDSIEREIAEGLPPALSGAIEELSERIGESSALGEELSLLAVAPEGEIVGAAISMPIPEGSFLSALVSDIAVYPEFRGLGLGKELLSRTIAHWTAKGYRWLVFASPVVHPSFLQVLHRFGFVEKGHASVLDLADAHHH
ncbi:MAG TPA: UPF0158 family protein [Treponemataceae bacterium]|nr:UPF0158 family protein [Treponemataceae bacterium]